MKLVVKNPKFVVYDDVLPPDVFEKIWVHVQYENYTNALGGNNWLKVWRLGDNNPLGSQEYYWNKKPFNNYMDVVSHVFNQIAMNSTDLVGDWYDMILRTYIYPRDTKLSWHNDADAYAGAFTYYVHPKWGSTWGGELMVAEVPAMEDLKKRPLATPHMDHEWEDEYLLERGVGQWLSPKPNRCVLMTGGVYHSVNRVDANAGDHARVSIVGFLLKSKAPVPLRLPDDEVEVKLLDIGNI